MAAAATGSTWQLVLTSGQQHAFQPSICTSGTISAIKATAQAASARVKCSVISLGRRAEIIVRPCISCMVPSSLHILPGAQ